MSTERDALMVARRAWLATPLIVVALAAGSYGLYAYLTPPPLPAGFLYGNGHIEGTEVRVASEVTGRVVDSRLVEGKTVAAGDLLVRIDDADLRIQLNRSLAEEKDLERLRSDQEAQLVPLRHHLATAQADLARYRSLTGSGVASVQRLQQAENAFEDAQRQLRALEGQISATDTFLDAARQRVELAQSQLAKTGIKAPIGGVILVKTIEPGEFAAPGKLVAVLVDLHSLQLKVFVPEADIGKIKLGDPARMKTSAFADRLYDARVSRVDQQAQFTPRDIHMPEERTRMVFGVTLDLANPTGELKPGMPADAWIRWQDGARWPGTLPVPP
jgi:HlyD family secretion protein